MCSSDLFAAGVLIAAHNQAPQATVDGLALAFIVARLAYIGCYVGNLATLRSLVWMAALGVNIALFVVAATR